MIIGSPTSDSARWPSALHKTSWPKRFSSCSGSVLKSLTDGFSEPDRGGRPSAVSREHTCLRSGEQLPCSAKQHIAANQASAEFTWVLSLT